MDSQIWESVTVFDYGESSDSVIASCALRGAAKQSSWIATARIVHLEMTIFSEMT
jgi:hypothetical protein